jgi:hypothetical protein
MYVIGHDDCGLQIEALSVIVDAVRKNEIAGWSGNGVRMSLQKVTNRGRPGFW